MCDFKYYLPSTNDHADRTAEIRAMVEQHGVCLLGAGTYVVSGVDMPDHTTLEGMGGATTVLLREDVQDGYAVKVGSFCTVKGIHFQGDPEQTDRPADVGSRHGILFEGNATTKDWQGQKRNSVVSDCFITGFSGGGITCRGTGYSTLSCMLVSDCHILYCGAGINISWFSEFHKFTNVLSEKCRYGCINNGGNNVFANCGFNANTTAFYMDNSHGNSVNNSHGSAVACTFNHSDGNNGIGIHAIGMTNGYMFSGCQIFFSKIVLEDCKGFIFDTTNYGRKVDVIVKGGGLTMFTNSAFETGGLASVQVTDNDHVKFINCYTREGDPVVG